MAHANDIQGAEEIKAEFQGLYPNTEIVIRENGRGKKYHYSILGVVICADCGKRMEVPDFMEIGSNLCGECKEARWTKNWEERNAAVIERKRRGQILDNIDKFFGDR